MSDKTPSLFDQMRGLEVGESTFVEFETREKQTNAQRSATASSRYRGDMVGRKYTTECLVAVGNQMQTRRLLRIERTE